MLRIFFPTSHFTIQSPLTLATAVERMRQVAQPRPVGKQKIRARPYEGEVSNQSFRVNRAIGYSHTWLPVVNGTLIGHPAGTTIDVKMSVHPSLQILSGIWLVLVFAISIVLFRFAGAARSPELLIIPGFLLFIYVVVANLTFWLEAKKAEEDLKVVFGTFKRTRPAPAAQPGMTSPQAVSQGPIPAGMQATTATSTEEKKQEATPVAAVDGRTGTV